MTGVAPVTLLHLTDPHLFEDESREFYGVNTASTFRAALEKGLATIPGPLDAILVTGDIAEDGRRATYERFQSIMGRLGVPVMCVPGNHEDPATLSAVIHSPPLYYCGSASFRGWRVVMLESHVPGEDSGWLDEDELDRLVRDLAEAAERNVLVCLHHHSVSVGSPWLDTMGLRNAATFHALLYKHGNVRGVLSGHVHQAFDQMQLGIRMLCTPSTCAQFTPNTRSCVMDLKPPGFRWLKLMPSGEIVTEVVWLDELRRAEKPPDSRLQAMRQSAG